MLIDWFTVAAQALNFLILVWLMKRYLYQPILHAIDALGPKMSLKSLDHNPRPFAESSVGVDAVTIAKKQRLQ